MLVSYFIKYDNICYRNVVYNLSLTDLTEQRRLVWYSPPNDVQMCVVKGKDEESCQNYIRVLVSLGPGRLLVCGTNSFKPFCREYSVQRDSYHMEREKSGQAVCPYDPDHNSTAVYADGELYSGTVADFSGMEPIIYREPLQTEPYDSMTLNDGELYSGTVADFSGMEPIIYREPLQTEPYDSMTLNAPDFVNSLVHGNFVYFFFRETAVEYINCGKAVFSRVARVCRDDRGGPHRFKQRWTSFLKSRLNCSVAGDFPFYFNEIQSTTELIEGVYGGLNAQLIYGTFTTPPNSISGSAVCAFSMQDIADTFEGTFKEQSAINSNWLPVNSAKVPEPRPGTCNNDSRQLPDQTLNFIKTHALMDESVPTFFGEPIVIRTSFHYRFTQIAVDPQVKTPGGKAYDVLFIGTDNGKIIKAINAVSYDSNKRAVPVVVEELQAFGAGSPVRALRVARAGRDAARLIAVSDREVLSLRLHRCSSDKISSCSECVALQDPYCAWDKQAGRCRAYSHGVSRWLDDTAFYQSVSTGSHAACPHRDTKTEQNPKANIIGVGKDASAVGGLSSGLYDDARGESKGEVINIVQDKDGKGSTNNNEGPEVLAADPVPAAYSVETLALAVAAGALCALGAGFAAGYLCGRRCRKDEDDNMPYPDTEYEYFEQRQNINRIQAEPKLLQQVEEVTYAEPVLAPQPKPASPRATLRKHAPYHAPHTHPNMHAHPHHETLFQFQPDNYRRDNFGTLRSHQYSQISWGDKVIDALGTSHRIPPRPVHISYVLHSASRGVKSHQDMFNAGVFGPQGDGYRRGNDNGFSTTRSVKKVYL
ncbi:Semaphorin-1A [Papilio xuthus]|uniref:Semaphorin-1A n=1 Tax=Papilio xuthus TaxID=66420 RepID=A0A194QED6_PAPXU|nr:Semaphorin-1A [Papilio xuthus]